MAIKRPALAACACLLVLPSAAHASYSFQLVGTTVSVTGDDASDVLSVQVSGTDFVFDVGADGSPEFTIDRSTFDTVIIRAGAGDDTVSVGPGTAGDLIVIDGEAGDDVINGGNGGEVILGGDGDDTIDGNQGSDQISGGAGRDVFVWDPGDGSDTIDGGTGSDVLRFNGSNANENMSLNPFGVAGHALLTRDIGAITIDMTGIETVDIRMLGGADTFTGGAGLAAIFERVQVHGGAGVDILNGGDSADTLDGGPDPGDMVNGGAGDDILIGEGDGDTLTGGDGNDRFVITLPDAGLDSMDGGPGTDVLAVTGTAADDRFSVAGGAGSWTVSEAGTAIQNVLDMEVLAVDALEGDDSLTVAAGALDALTLDLDGGPGRDALSGTNGPDVMRGGEGDDTLRGGDGNDRLFGDGGTDRLLGGAGADELHCGGLGDVLDATAEDTVDADCVPAPPPPVDGAGPVVTLEAFPAAVKRGALARSGLSGYLDLDEPAQVEVVLLGRLKRAPKGSVVDVSLAERALPLAPDLRRLVDLSPDRKLVRRLARRAGLTLRVTATDAAANPTSMTLQIRIRR
jgi:Ca2+-binding RTX toxin-like protein